MSEEANIEKAPNRDDHAPEVAPIPVVDAPGTRETSAPVKARAAQSEVASEPVVVSAAQEPEVKPKRRTRKTADSAAAPAAPRRRARAVAESEDVEVPAKRRARKAKAAAGDAEAPAATAEVMQARALAQISQASVVRRQRRAAERAAEVLSAVEPAVDTQEVKVEAPLVDPALRPHRRGRKPKAYVEAEKAAAAALAAQQAALMAARDESKADGPAEKDSQKSDREPGIQVERVEETSVESEQPAPAASTEETSEKEAAVKRDARPGRASRARKAVREDAPKSGADEDGSKPKSEEASEKADQPADKAEAKAEEKLSGKQSRRNHKDRRDAERAEGPSSKADARRERRERQKENRKQRNNRFAPTEPSLTREELTAMKVAELREKARSLELDPTGVKKADLVEMIYAAAARAEGFRDIEGILDMDNQGFGYIRAHGYMPSRDDAFVPAQMIRAAGLRAGDLVAGTLRPMRANDKLPGLAKIRSVNGLEPEQIKHRPKFADLTPIYPNEPLKMEHGKDSITGRAIDIVSPIGKGQRGLIVSPPKAGKTTILKKICQSISINNPEVHLICLLVDERPEEVTDMQRSIKGDVVASTFDMPADNHTRVSELVIERAKRIVELGGDVVVVLDSITRLARAYNLAAPASGRILSGGVDSAALYPPKRFLGAARNIENGGSLTILASALVDTGSKMDEVIFEEFKGTGNMELKLDRDLADRRIFPAIDPVASGTRNEDLLVDEQMRPFMWGIRRILAGMNNTERAAASFIKGLKGTNSNQDFLIRTAKKAADHPEAL
ncbi:transcription termination factor Rho [Collinsella intestinalis DSM 13280]|uniref:Transcription termination factor Rho n=1 Tax=Collinsella intestinalis DSM 13280 TaxID=521003 RepID=C4F966_9ACTN|nr:transcription termination factor Rho [Collinsella intestinalis DSM 13280]